MLHHNFVKEFEKICDYILEPCSNSEAIEKLKFSSNGLSFFQVRQFVDPTKHFNIITNISMKKLSFYQLNDEYIYLDLSNKVFIPKNQHIIYNISLFWENRYETLKYLVDNNYIIIEEINQIEIKDLSKQYCDTYIPLFIYNEYSKNLIFQILKKQDEIRIKYNVLSLKDIHSLTIDL